MNDHTSHKESIKPLGLLIDFYLKVHTKTSLRALLFGADPTLTPRFITANEGRWINRDCFVDLYALAWPIAEWAALWWLGTASAVTASYVAVAIVGCIAAYRTNELLGGIFYILIRRARADFADGRKLLITLLAYFEPMMLFAVLHGVIAAIVAAHNLQGLSGAYDTGGRLWRASTIFHFSVGCYTTVGWGDVSPRNPYAIVLSDCEAITGIIMLTLTVSRFISAALDPLMSVASQQGIGSATKERVAEVENTSKSVRP